MYTSNYKQHVADMLQYTQKSKSSLELKTSIQTCDRAAIRMGESSGEGVRSLRIHIKIKCERVFDRTYRWN
jgi:hypothetical protein